jgi:pilus assembly protein CpaD
MTNNFSITVPKLSAAKALAICLTAISLGGCASSDETRPQVAATTILEPTQRHPILVSQQPSTLALRVPRGSSGLTPHQKSQLVEFFGKYRATDAGNSKIVVSVPSGAPNEVAAMRAVADMRDVMIDSGFTESTMSVEPYHNERDPQPPVRVQYLKYIAEGPECGTWPNNLAESPTNLSYHNFGCAQQKNLASMVANPADLLGPRTMTAANSDRRGVVFEKYIKGDVTNASKGTDEKANSKSTN